MDRRQYGLALQLALTDSTQSKLTFGGEIAEGGCVITLRPLEHPDLWDYVVHMTGRPRGKTTDVSRAIARMSAAQRTAAILRETRIRGFLTYFADHPVVCFTESTPKGLEYLIARQGYEPWGLVFSKEVIYAAGGAPALYVRGDEWTERKKLSAPMRSRAVKFQPGASEWLEEREWRCPVAGDPPAFCFELDQVHAVIVGSYNWVPSEAAMAYRASRDDWELEETPAQWGHQLRRWWWDRTNHRLAELPQFPDNSGALRHPRYKNARASSARDAHPRGT